MTSPRIPPAAAIRRRRILVTFARLNVGGAEMRTLRLLQQIHADRRGVEVFVYVLSGLTGTLDDAFKAAGAVLIYGRPGLAGLPAFAAQCAALKVDVAHINASLGSWAYAMAAWIAGARTRIGHIRSVSYADPGLMGAAKTALYRPLTNRACTLVVGVCDAGQSLGRTPTSRWRTIYNGFDAGPSRKAPAPRGPDDPLQIVMVGRADAMKNHERAIRILARLNADVAVACLNVVGRVDPDRLAILSSLAAGLGVADRVRFGGETLTPLEDMARADVLILPSLWEGLPGVVIEALSCGAPVVASDLPGVREIAARTEGVTVLSLDAPDEVWAEALTRAARDAQPERIRSAFLASPFTFERHYRDMMDIWGVSDRSGADVQAASTSSATSLPAPSVSAA